MFNTALHEHIIPTMLLTVREPGRHRARRSHNYVGDILASSNQVCFPFKQGVPSGFLTGGAAPSERRRHVLLAVFANTPLSAATGVSESRADADEFSRVDAVCQFVCVGVWGVQGRLGSSVISTNRHKQLFTSDSVTGRRWEFGSVKQNLFFPNISCSLVVK